VTREIHHILLNFLLLHYFFRFVRAQMLDFLFLSIIFHGPLDLQQTDRCNRVLWGTEAAVWRARELASEAAMVSGRQARRAGGNSGPSERPCWEAVGQASGDADPTVVRRRAWASSSTGRAWAPTARSVARIVDAGRSKLQSGNI
jgi:hypothetical protein